MFTQHFHPPWSWCIWTQLGHAAWTCSVDMQYEDMDMKHWHAAWICSKGMQHGHTTWTCKMHMKHVHAARTGSMACRMAYSMNLDLQNRHEERPWSMGIRVQWFSHFFTKLPSLTHSCLPLDPSVQKISKKDCHFCHFGCIFFYFFKNLLFFRTFQNQFYKSVLNQSLQKFQGVIFDKYCS